MDAGRRVPSGRRVINGSDSAASYRQPDVPQAAPAPTAGLQTPQRPTPTQPIASKKQKSPKRLKWPIIIIVVLLILGVAGYFGWTALRTGVTVIDSGKYQAVFFTNGQVYFGKLSSQNADYLQLTDVYYLQTNSTTDGENPQQTSTDQNDVQLIKLGDEIHGPEDQMVISKDQILFFENLKADGKVSQSIQQFKGSK